MTFVHLRSFFGWLIFVLSLFAFESAQAQTCPENLSAIESQVVTPELKARLSLSLEPLIEQAGGVEEAVGRTQAALAEALSRRAEAEAAGRDVQAFDDAILIFTTQLQALQCLLGE